MLYDLPVYIYKFLDICRCTTWLGSVILKTILHGHHEVPALVLGHLYFPPPVSGGGPGVYVYVDLVTLIRGWHPHVLPRVVATDCRRDDSVWVGDRQGVLGKWLNYYDHQNIFWLFEKSWVKATNDNQGWYAFTSFSPYLLLTVMQSPNLAPSNWVKVVVV